VFSESRCQLNQHFTQSFYTRRSQKRKKIQLSHKYLFTILGSAHIKAVRRTLIKLQDCHFDCFFHLNWRIGLFRCLNYQLLVQFYSFTFSKKNKISSTNNLIFSKMCQFLLFRLFNKFCYFDYFLFFVFRLFICFP